MAKIAVVIGSVREGRVSDRLAKWVVMNLEEKAEAELIDLKDYPMPFMDEPISPRYNPERQPKPEVQKWLDKIGDFDGYVLVTPEYNRSTSAVLKNALDYLDYQMERKPVALVGHGSSGGAQAIANLRMALPGVGAVSVPEALFFKDGLADSINEAGELMPELREKPYGPQSQLEGQLKSLLWYSDALTTARAAVRKKEAVAV